MKPFLLMLLCGCTFLLRAQELYPYTEPASNMPARSLSAKGSAMYMRSHNTGGLMQRYAPEVMFGINKAWMLHAAATFSDMYSKNGRFESVRLYTKYRFLSQDAVHRHFRMAAFATGSWSRNPMLYNELSLMGDQSGVQAGVIATQLLNKLALSGTASLIEVLHRDRWKKQTEEFYVWESFNYSLSAGYLLYPFDYTDYKQTNINLYAELLGSRTIGWPYGKGFIDLAPSLQFIFRSTGKLNVGYRFQLAGDVSRMGIRSFMVSYEHLFLNALRKKKQE